MTPERFEHLAETHGADIRRWPAAEQATAQVLAAGDPAAREMLDAAARLDDLLHADRTTEPGAALRERVIAAAPAARAATRFWRWASAAGIGFGLAAACASGVAVGMTVAPPSVTRVIAGPAPAAIDAPDDAAALVAPADGGAG